jgi:uncharacterized RDD family membrane protein YckC
MKITHKKYPHLQLATEDERSKNFGIDFGFSSIIAVIIVYFLGFNFFYSLFIYLFIRFVYYFSLEFLYGRTLAKYNNQTMVVDQNGKRPTTLQLIKRNLSRFVSLFSFVSDDERAIHDVFSNTFVIKDESLKKIDTEQYLLILLLLLFLGYWITTLYNKDSLDAMDVFLLIVNVMVFGYVLFMGIKKITRRNT